MVPAKSVIGGGTTPGAMLESFALSIQHPRKSSSELLTALRRRTPPVIGRVQEDCVLLDLRTVPPEQDRVLAGLIRDAAEEDCR